MWNSFTTHTEQLYSQNMGCDTQVAEHSYKQVQNLKNHYTAVISKGLIKGIKIIYDMCQKRVEKD
jgi:hypothetical protein